MRSPVVVVLRGLELVPLKTRKRARTLVLPPAVANVLRAHPAHQAAARLSAGPEWADTGDLVFTMPFGTRMDPDNYRHRLGRLADSAGPGHIGTHVLRDSAGSFLYAEGVPMRTISEILGHAPTRVTEDVYVHLLERSRSDVSDVIGRALFV